MGQRQPCRRRSDPVEVHQASTGRRRSNHFTLLLALRRDGGITPFSGTSFSIVSDSLCSGLSPTDDNCRPAAFAVREGLDATTAFAGAPGNELPNAPHFTASLSAEYTLPLSMDWAATLHGDYYWQDNSWARIFNDNPYDRIHGYSNVKAALILSSANGWQAMVKGRMSPPVPVEELDASRLGRMMAGVWEELV